MIGPLILIVLVAIVAAIAVSGNRRGHVRPVAPAATPHPTGTGARATTTVPPVAPLGERLHGWARAGLITQDEVSAILAYEGEGVVAAPPERRVSVVAELLGYLGGALVLIGVFTLISQFWSDMNAATRLVLVGTAAVGFGVAGALVHEDIDPALWRLRGVLWLFSTGATALFVGLLAADVADWSPQTVALCVGTAAAVQSGLMWWRQERPLQHLSLYVGIVAAGAGLGALLDLGVIAGSLALWTLGAAWALLGWRRLLPPHLVAVLLGIVTALYAAALLGNESQAAATLFGLGTAIALLGFGAAVHEFPFTIGGVLGLLIYVPATTAYFFADTIGVPVVILLSGAAVLVVAVLLLRRGGPGTTPDGRADTTAGGPSTRAATPVEAAPTTGGSATATRPPRAA